MSQTNLVSGDFTLVTTGDSLIFQRISIFKEKEFLKVREILKDADVAFNNFETIIPGERGVPRYKTDPTAWMTSPRYVLDELLWMGFNMFSLANNHSMDYSEGGLLETKRIFDEVGVANAGTGRILSEARAPAYLNTEKGRVALIAVNTRGEDIPAGEPRGRVPGRPGLNPMRSKEKVLLDGEGFKKLSEVAEKLGLAGPKEGKLNFLGNHVELSDRNDIHTEPYEPDLEGNLAAIENARKNADYVFVSVHNHDKLRPGVMYFDDTIEYIAKFVEDFCRAAIDAGADAILGHGTHCLNGIEIYKGHPIFYGMGNFISQNYNANPKPYDWYEARGLHKELYSDEPKGSLYPTLDTEADKRRVRRLETSVVAKVRFHEAKTREIFLYPIQMNRGEKQGGHPFLVTGENGEEILTRLSRLSKNYGTKIVIEKGVGKILLK
jgi:poly-gamma-glutamate synthesis protein (capsule biosynthesis protein)